MTFTWIVFISAILLAIAINFHTYGKFWHKHNWRKHLEVESDSIYSPNKTNIHAVYKCDRDNCRAFKVHVSG